MKKVFSLIVFISLIVACAPHYRSSGYDPDDVGKPITIQKGEVENVRPAEIEHNQDTGLGTLSGATLGGVAGNAIGNGKGQDIATVLGVIVGAIAGSAAEKGGNKRQADEITVRLDDGRVFAVVQEVGQEKFQIGDRVEVLKTPDGRMRVRRAPKNAPPAPTGEKVREPGEQPNKE